ncbi:hypothetical protein ACFE04_008983 [Oxalis oulophora]
MNTAGHVCKRERTSTYVLDLSSLKNGSNYTFSLNFFSAKCNHIRNNCGISGGADEVDPIRQMEYSCCTNRAPYRWSRKDVSKVTLKFFIRDIDLELKKWHFEYDQQLLILCTSNGGHFVLELDFKSFTGSLPSHSKFIWEQQVIPQSPTIRSSCWEMKIVHQPSAYY